MKVKHNGKECDVPHWALEQAHKNGYAKGVKEFAERLKQVFYSDDFGDPFIRNIIDEVTKEMVGADNGR